MNARERILAVFAGEQPDTTPIFPKIAFANVLACEGMTVREYMTDPKCMARACISAYRKFGWDGVSIHTDISSEGKALGTIYEQPENAPGILKKYLLNDISEVDKVKVPDPYTTEPMKTVIEAIRIVKREIGEEAFIMGWTNGPLNVAGQLYNLDELLVTLLEEPEEVHVLLEKCTEVACTYAAAMIEAGADMIAYGHATASQNVISKNCYLEFALPYEQKLVRAIHDHGAKACTHICGNIEKIVDVIAQNGSDVIDFDHVCDIDRLRSVVPDKIYRGNVDPALFALGTPEEIRETVRALLAQEGTKKKFFLGSGCEINTNTPVENLKAFVEAGRAFGKCGA
ncbi:MAG: uroporphyrinogen decarboxylase family protein [Eubacteriales bacterium]|nr:uroporphyrinogen decarboxylase family protein [Eubacteriales bacterium]